MPIKMYEAPCNWFQAGWNIVVKDPNICNLPTTLSGWALYDLKAGIAAAMYKRTLPNHWLG